MVKSGLLVNDYSGVTYDYSVLNADQLLALAVFKHLIIVLDFIVCMKCCVWFSQLIRFYISKIGAVPDYSLTHAVDITCYKISLVLISSSKSIASFRLPLFHFESMHHLS